jgi:hypothetical protein
MRFDSKQRIRFGMSGGGGEFGPSLGGVCFISEKFPMVSMVVRLDCCALTDTEARRPIGTSGFFYWWSFTRYG